MSLDEPTTTNDPLFVIEAAFDQALQELINNTVEHLKGQVTFPLDIMFEKSAFALVNSWVAKYAVVHFNPEDMEMKTD